MGSALPLTCPGSTVVTHEGARSQARLFDFPSTMTGHCTWGVLRASRPHFGLPASHLAEGLSPPTLQSPAFLLSCRNTAQQVSSCSHPAKVRLCCIIMETEVLCPYRSRSQGVLPVGHAPLFHGTFPPPGACATIILSGLSTHKHGPSTSKRAWYS